jgi:Tol biopolymer transport system component
VLTNEPDLDAVPPRVRPLLRRCLEKDPRKRLRDIGDAMSLVGDVAAPAGLVEGTDRTAARAAGWRTVAGWSLAGLLAAALAAALYFRPASPVDGSEPVVRFQIMRPGLDVYLNTSAAFAVSPDGSRLAYYGSGPSGGVSLIVRTLTTGESRELAAMTGAPIPNAVFWSPDGQSLVNGTSGSGAHLIDVASATSRLLCQCRFQGGSWNRDGVILLGSPAQINEGIRRVSASGRDQAMATKVDASRGERDSFPAFLPDGRRFLFTRVSSDGGQVTYVGSLDGAEPVRLVEGSRHLFVPASNGLGPHVLGIEPAGLVAQPFDPIALTVNGEVRTLVAGAGVASISDNGVLATSPIVLRAGMIPTWFDRSGKPLGTVGEPVRTEFVGLSPDGKRLALNNVRSVPGSGDIFLRDVATGASTRFSFEPGGETAGVWSPDGTRLIYSSQGRDSAAVPMIKAIDGTGAATPVVTVNGPAWVNDWSPDGKFVILSRWSETSSTDISLWFVALGGAAGGTPSPYVSEQRNQKQARISPDGRFVAYISDETGAWEIYVRPFPDAEQGKWMVSDGGGVEPRWSRDGKELFYFAGQTLMAVPVNLRPTFSNGSPRALFEARIQPNYTNDAHRWHVAPDGQRFLLLIPDGNDQAPPLEVIVNWTTLLQR